MASILRRARLATRSTRRARFAPEALERREVMAAPTAYEQYMLELINRARANPAAEGQRLLALAQTDPLVRSATRAWDLYGFVQKISSYPALPPLAFNTRLIDAARQQDLNMLAQNSQRHSAPGFLNNPAIATNVDGQVYYNTSGASWSTGENIYAFSGNVNSNLTEVYVDYFHAGFMIDWGNPDFGHLTNILAPGPAEAVGSSHYPFSEIGIGIITGVHPTSPPDPNPPNPANAGINVGPDLVAQEFGWRSTSRASLTGTVFTDLDRNQFYRPGEGLGGITITAYGTGGQGTYSVQTWASGGYSLGLPAGTYGVVAAGPGLPGTRSTFITIGQDNVGWSVNVDPSMPADLPVPADYTGDGRADLATYQTTTANWTIRDSTTGLTSVVPFGWAGVDIPAPGKYDSPNVAEVAVYRPTTGQWFIKSPTGTRIVAFGWGGHDVPVPGDYDGDGKTDLAVYRPETAQWFILRSSDGGTQITAFGWAGVDQPVPAKYDGNGRTQMAVYRPTTAQWFVRHTNEAVTTTAFGWVGQDVPRPADYDGDGKADLAVYRPATGDWFIQQSTTGATQNIAFGGGGADQAVPAAYLGDGKTNLAVFRPSTADWFIRQATTGAFATYNFAQGGVPTTNLSVVGKYLPLPKYWSDAPIASPADQSAAGTSSKTTAAHRPKARHLATPKGPHGYGLSKKRAIAPTS